MTGSLTEFWRQMKLDETIHPLDKAILEKTSHSFRTGEPPPAFIGDIERAPVIVLFSNGGWDSHTAREFLQPENSPAKYVARLYNSSPCNPASVSAYYAKSNLASFIATGEVAFLNLIPYRSPKLSKESENRALAYSLASSQQAIKWTNRILKMNDRMVILKRTIWLDFIEQHLQQYLTRTSVQIGQHVSNRTKAQVSEFLARRR